MKKNNPDFSVQEFEKLSSCFTLSDMEIFVFPELFYSLVLANICSPIIWEWENDQWFKDIDKKNDLQKINRIKQFIMDHFQFNLDLQTWGLTNKLTEVNRFKEFVDMDILAKSNALFGYHGDKYYFDIDIRKHFGLDKYNGDTIPYWKTETVEAMSAFCNKAEYENGAGECVSFACLYAAALFIIGKIPLEKIYLMATPLHSQNFIDIDQGILTNNRRIVTKNMWYNGTELSDKARRALENEQITMVCHLSGYVHSIYKDASIDSESFRYFRQKLSAFLSHQPDSDTFRNFLRTKPEFQQYFQFSFKIKDTTYYIEVEKLFAYEQNSKNSFSDKSKKALLQEINTSELSQTPLENRTNLKDFEKHLIKKKGKFSCQKALDILEQYQQFIHVAPHFPCVMKNYLQNPTLEINTEMTREQILEYLVSSAEQNKMAEYFLYTYRLMNKIDWEPFLYACFTRSPICLETFGTLDAEQLYSELGKMNSKSIYDASRLATPDEACNFKTADGIEKAIIMATCLPKKAKAIEIAGEEATITIGNNTYKFQSDKSITKTLDLKKIFSLIKSLKD